MLLLDGDDVDYCLELSDPVLPRRILRHKQPERG